MKTIFVGFKREKYVLAVTAILFLFATNTLALQARVRYDPVNYAGWGPWVYITELKKCFSSWGDAWYMNSDPEVRRCPFEAATLLVWRTGWGFTEVCSDSIYQPKAVEVTAVEVNYFETDLTIPGDLKLVSSDGSVINDEVCVGDSVKVVKGVNKGEYWNEGGNDDSPSIYWVDDVESFVSGLVAFHEKTLTDEGYVTLTEDQEKEVMKDSAIDGYVDDLTGIPVFNTQFPAPNPTDCYYLLDDSNGKIEKDLDNGIASEELLKAMNLQDITSIQFKKTAYRTWGEFTGYEYNKDQTSMYITKDNNTLFLCGVHELTYSISRDVRTIGRLVCSIKDNSSSISGLVKEGDYYRVLNVPQIVLDQQNIVECTYYLYGLPGFSYKIDRGYGWDLNPYANNTLTLKRLQVPSIMDMDPGLEFSTGSGSYQFSDERQICSLEDLLRVGTINISKNLKVVSPADPKVEVSVLGADALKFGEPNVLRVLVKNAGDVDISIKSVYSNPEGKLLSCDSENLAPSKQAECLLSVTPIQGQGLSVEVSYDYKSCGRSQVGLVTQMLIDSKVVRPVLKEQSYLMGVHGACDNSYYSCYSASEGSLFAGYKCFKTANGFYTPATERFNMRFDLSDIPKNAEILGAKLYLKASEVGGKQTINVYSVNKIPEAVKCLPGGDICTKPYCGECKPLYDIDGTVASSAELSSTGQYSFDVTNQLKEKIAGDGIVSLQIRGAEGLWENQGQSSCSVENDWDKRDVSFDAGGRDGPYLEVVYK